MVKGGLWLGPIVGLLVEVPDAGRSDLERAERILAAVAHLRGAGYTLILLPVGSTSRYGSHVAAGGGTPRRKELVMLNMKNSPIGPEAMECEHCGTVPLSHLALDMPAPAAGWEAMLATHGIELIADDLGRPAISREDARTLMAERRKWELKHTEWFRRQDGGMEMETRR